MAEIGDPCTYYFFLNNGNINSISFQIHWNDLLFHLGRHTISKKVQLAKFFSQTMTWKTSRTTDPNPSNQGIVVTWPSFSKINKDYVALMESISMLGNGDRYDINNLSPFLE